MKPSKKYLADHFGVYLYTIKGSDSSPECKKYINNWYDNIINELVEISYDNRKAYFLNALSALEVRLSNNDHRA